jgi:hypothetical protein
MLRSYGHSLTVDGSDLHHSTGEVRVGAGDGGECVSKWADKVRVGTDPQCEVNGARTMQFITKHLHDGTDMRDVQVTSLNVPPHIIRTYSSGRKTNDVVIKQLAEKRNTVGAGEVCRQWKLSARERNANERRLIFWYSILQI